jgi:hypothetical protein
MSVVLLTTAVRDALITRQPTLGLVMLGLLELVQDWYIQHFSNTESVP